MGGSATEERLSSVSSKALDSAGSGLRVRSAKGGPRVAATEDGVRN